MSNRVCTTLCAGMALVLGFSASLSQAALPDGTVLAFNPGVPVFDSYGSMSDIASGSYFAVDLDGNGTFSGREKMPIEMHDGIILGISQPATPSAPGIDLPWTFFGVQGVISTSSPVLDYGDGTLDFSGWGANWHGIDIDIGDANAHPIPDTLRATIICSNNPCQVGDSYMLDYFGHVPMGHPSGFGGVWFKFHLEGTITDGVLPPRIAINVEGGTIQECTSHQGATVTASANVSLPPGETVESIDWTLNGEPVGGGEQIVQTLGLGVNALEAQLRTQSGMTASASSDVMVRDSLPPRVKAAFIDDRTGDQVTHVDKNSHIRIEANAEDDCDPHPDVQAMIGSQVNDGNVIAIQVERDRVSLSMPRMTLSVTARDASGNVATDTAELSIGK